MSSKDLASMPPFEVAGYRVEPSTLRITGSKGDARLEAKAMQVLLYLAENAGRVVSRGELEEQLWPGRILTEDAVTNAIAKLRKAFGDNARHPLVIETVPKSGYRLIARVAPVTEPAKQGGIRTTDRILATGGNWRTPLLWAAGASLMLLLLVLMLPRPTETPSFGTKPATDKPALTILPFTNLGASPEQDYFANGFTADLITDLSKVAGLLVIAPGSIFVYKDSHAGPKQISAELDVDYVVVGTVQRSGERLRVNVQLFEATAERTLWGERYEGVLDDIFDIQDQLTSAVITALKIELAPMERDLITRRPTTSLLAYDHYLRGLEDHGHRSKTQNQSAMEHFQRAIELDPEFTRAYTGLALAYSREAIDGWTPTPSRSLEQAVVLAAKASIMDPALPQVHFVTGQVALFRGRHIEAIEATQRAIQADPNYADAYAMSAWILNYAGRPNDALAALDEAMHLSPRPPGSYLEILGEIQFVQRRYLESVDTFARVLEINPSYARARMWMAAGLAHSNALERAEWEAIELLTLSPDLRLSRLAFAFPFKDPRELDILFDGLRKAGLTD